MTAATLPILPVVPMLQTPEGLGQGSTYVMWGDPETRKLETYHLILAPTHACNLRCAHCYLPDHARNLLPEAVAVRLVQEWASIVLAERDPYRGIFHVKGGEPFVVPYLDRIARRVIETRALQFMLTTNGTILTSTTRGLLASWQEALGGYLTIVVSLDGATARTHDLLRGEGSYDRTIPFLEYLRGLGVKTYLNCVLHQLNLDDVPAFLDLAQSLGVSQVNFLPLVPKGYGAGIRTTQLPHLVIHERLRRVYESVGHATRLLLAGSLPHIEGGEQAGRFAAAFECVAAYRGLFYIRPSGSVHSCPNLEDDRHAVGNVTTEALYEIHQRLGTLYQSLHLGVPNDRYLCSGERLRYSDAADGSNLRSLRVLQQDILARTSTSPALGRRVAFCVSRNW
jgi:MoaA/NifB/PqqE/SkfB family radical SAM enzyme